MHQVPRSPTSIRVHFCVPGITRARAADTPGYIPRVKNAGRPMVSPRATARALEQNTLAPVQQRQHSLFAALLGRKLVRMNVTRLGHAPK